VNEPFDVEISRALKKETAESLQGWEFTPAMQAKVMQRIRAEATSDDDAADAPSASPARQRNWAERARPLSWVAAAAAAVVLAVNINWSGFGMGGSALKESAATPDVPSLEAATSSPANANAQVVAPASAQVTDTTPKPDAQPATGDTSGSGTQANAGIASIQAPTQRSREMAFALPAPAARQESLADGVATLAAPPSAKMAITPEQVTDPADGTGPEVGIAFTAAAVENVSGAVTNAGSVFTLTNYGLTFTSADMATVQEISLEGLSGASVVTVAADGNAAVVGAEGRVYLIGADNQLKRTIAGEAAIERVGWSNNGLLAVADGKRVVVYAADTGEAKFEIAASPGAEVAFAPDGTLAVYVKDQAGAPLLTLTDAKGSEIARQQPAEAGSGLEIAAGGKVIVAGGHAYDAAGNSLWAMPLTPVGVTALGSDRVVGWNDQTVLTVGAADGVKVWQANWEGTGRITRVVPAPDGSLMTILAETDDGPVLWVVEAGGKVRLTERLEQMPVELGLVGNQVVMILPTAVQYRAIPE
jgi:hypothetical protein